MADKEELIAKLEAATGPDRELDCRIFCATAESPFESYFPDCVLAVSGGFRARLEISEIPNYTSLIDAAMRLMPRDSVWGVSHRDPDPQAYPKKFRATVMPPLWQKSVNDGQGFSDANPAIALCIAALRAWPQS